MEFLTQVNWIAVLIGGVFNMVLGSLWYGPLFGKAWLKAIGKSQDEIESSATMYILPFVAGLIAAYILAAMIAGLRITVWWQGVAIGTILWLGIGATGTFTVGTFEASPRGAWMLYTLYQLVVYAGQGLMFVLWKL